MGYRFHRIDRLVGSQTRCSAFSAAALSSSDVIGKAYVEDWKLGRAVLIALG